MLAKLKRIGHKITMTSLPKKIEIPQETAKNQSPAQNSAKVATPRVHRFRSRVWNVLKEAIPRIAAERRRAFIVNAEYCRLCILDAFQGRLSNGLANNSKKSAWIYAIFCFQTSDALFQCVIGACIFHTMSVFIEPESACSNSSIFSVLQVLVLLIYAVDIGLKMGYEGISVSFLCSA